MLEIFQEAGRAAWPHILNPDALAALTPPERWRAVIDSTGDETVLISERNGQPAGFAVLLLKEGSGELDSFYIHPDSWGKGVGRELMAACLAHLKSNRATEARLWTAEENHRPRRFYELQGWRTTGETRSRSLKGSDFVELRYAIDLAGKD